MTFYHGTSTLASIDNKILPPDNHNFGINEPDRTKHSQKVFFTTIKGYAEKYARQCCSRVGGKPIVYEVYSSNPKLMVKVDGCDIYYDSEAIVGGSYLAKDRYRKYKKKTKLKNLKEV